MTRLSLKAVIAGITVDLVATNLLLLPVVIALAARPEVQAAAPAQQGDAILAAWEASSWAYPTGMLLGSLASIWGGWIAAGIAGHAPRIHGALSALGCVALGMYGWVSGAGQASAWVHVGFLILTPGLGLLGGVLRERRDALLPLQAGGETTAIIREPLRGWHRALLVFDRVMLAVALLTLLVFTGIALLAESTVPYQTLGSWVLAGYAALVMLAYHGAARALQMEHPMHGRFHVGALVLTLAPFTTLL